MDDYHYKLVLNEKNLNEILRKLREHLRILRNMTRTTVKVKLNSTRMSKNKKVDKYLIRFDNLVE